MRRLLPVLLLAAALPASEARRSDLQLWIDSEPTSFDYVITGPAGASRSGSDGFDRALAARLGGRWTVASPGRSWAPQYGADLVLRDADYAGVMTVRSYALAVAGGLAWTPADAWQVEGELFADYGLTSADSGDQPQIAAFTASGTSLAYGLRANVSWRCSRRWLVGAGLGWMRESANLSGDTVDLTWDRQGLVVSLGVSWRFDVRPAGLE